MKRCPVCNTLMPLLSKVCPACSNVIDAEEEGTSAEELADDMEYTVHCLRQLPQPGVGSELSRLTVVIYPAAAAFLAAYAFISEAGLFWILASIFIILSVIALVRRGKKRTAALAADRQFAELRSSCELYERYSKRNFGEHPEMRRLLKEIETEVREIESTRKAARSRSLAICTAILAVMLALFIAGAVSVTSAVRHNESEELAERTDWRSKMERYPSLPAGLRKDAATDIIRLMTAEAQTEQAEKFFFAQVMGQPGDYDCAAMIARAYLEAGMKERAEEFVSRCTGLRYSSDTDRLKSIIR